MFQVGLCQKTAPLGQGEKPRAKSQFVVSRFHSRAANNFSFLKGHMSDQVSILVGQNRNVVGRLFLNIVKWKSF